MPRRLRSGRALRRAAVLRPRSLGDPRPDRPRVVVPTGYRTVDQRDKESGLIRAVSLPTFDAWVEAWTPEETLQERARSDQAPYDVWVRQGWLNAIPGKVIRYDHVAAPLAEASQEYEIAGLAYDA